MRCANVTSVSHGLPEGWSRDTPIDLHALRSPLLLFLTLCGQSTEEAIKQVAVQFERSKPDLWFDRTTLQWQRYTGPPRVPENRPLRRTDEGVRLISLRLVWDKVCRSLHVRSDLMTLASLHFFFKKRITLHADCRAARGFGRPAGVAACLRRPVVAPAFDCKPRDYSVRMVKGLRPADRAAIIDRKRELVASSSARGK